MFKIETQNKIFSFTVKKKKIENKNKQCIEIQGSLILI